MNQFAIVFMYFIFAVFFNKDYFISQPIYTISFPIFSAYLSLHKHRRIYSIVYFLQYIPMPETATRRHFHHPASIYSVCMKIL